MRSRSCGGDLEIGDVLVGDGFDVRVLRMPMESEHGATSSEHGAKSSSADGANSHIVDGAGSSMRGISLLWTSGDALAFGADLSLGKHLA